MTQFVPITTSDVVALRKESVDRNQRYQRKSLACRLSLSARRAWIEIVRGTIAAYPILVALRKESVDRNIRNLLPCGGVFNVALRKESVDRNHHMLHMRAARYWSLSARRAWIEIL